MYFLYIPILQFFSFAIELFHQLFSQPGGLKYYALFFGVKYYKTHLQILIVFGFLINYKFIIKDCLVFIFLSLFISILMPISYSHNPEHQWKLLADKQFQESKLRQQQQKNLQKQLKLRYLQELNQQIKNKQKAIQFEKHLEKSVDKIQIERSVQDQKRNIQMQKIKNSMIMDRTNKMDEQNLSFEMEKRRREQEIKQLQRSIEKAKNQETQMLMNYQKEKEQKKKQYLRLFLKSTMQQQKERKRILLERERELQKAKLRQLQRIQQRTDQERQKELQRIKERAKKVDYGSHSIFEQNQNKSLIQKKSQQWQTYKDAIQRQQILKKMQEEERIGRKAMQKYYNKQLKNQIWQREEQKRQRSFSQRERDRSLMDESQKFGWMMEEQKRNMAKEKKKLLHNYLQVQQEQKEYEKRNENAMKQNELKLNLGSLMDAIQGKGANNVTINNHTMSPTITRDIPTKEHNNNNNRYSTIDVIDSSEYYSRPTPGDTFRLDHERLKQLQRLSKSIKSSSFTSGPNQKIDIDLKSHRYFAAKGINILG